MTRRTGIALAVLAAGLVIAVVAGLVYPYFSHYLTGKPFVDCGGMDQQMCESMVRGFQEVAEREGDVVTYVSAMPSRVPPCGQWTVVRRDVGTLVANLDFCQ